MAVVHDVHYPALDVPRISFSANWWVIIAIGILVWAVHSPSFWFLDFVHIGSAILWTGTDIFMGFILGPIMRRLDPASRRALYLRLVPRMLFYMPTMSTLTITAGFSLANRLGFFMLPTPRFYWVVAALAIVTIMTIQGFGILLPTNLRVFFEMRKERADVEKVQRLMTWYIKVVASQAVMQVLIIAIMARFRAGF
ncbi:MAG: hypothetical protein HYY96_10015 [Candidatus Tectomicrobia bacterium]|nr:hypothetical protein [Candidatus Tectomicrobia bacterium]